MRWVLVAALAAACNREERVTAPPAVAIVHGAIDAAAADAGAGPCPVANAQLGKGLVAERWHVTTATPLVGEPCIDVVRADLAHYDLRAFTNDRKPATAWLDVVAVTNAGMFHDDGRPVGLVVADGKVRGHDNKKFGGYLAWHPVSPKSPPVAIVCSDAARAEYRSLVQSYRLLDCEGRALPWQDPKHYSAAAIGVDRAGRVVFLHVRAAFTMAELSIALAAHDLQGAIFLEGGPEASLVVRGDTGSLERVGSYETGFNENDENRAFWDLPNVIALVSR